MGWFVAVVAVVALMGVVEASAAWLPARLVDTAVMEAAAMVMGSRKEAVEEEAEQTVEEGARAEADAAAKQGTEERDK